MIHVSFCLMCLSLFVVLQVLFFYLVPFSKIMTMTQMMTTLRMKMTTMIHLMITISLFYESLSYLSLTTFSPCLIYYYFSFPIVFYRPTSSLAHSYFSLTIHSLTMMILKMMMMVIYFYWHISYFLYEFIFFFIIIFFFL